VRSNGKFVQIALCVVLLGLTMGCSGINASKSVSPLDFILPGLLQADPPPANPDRTVPAEEPLKQVAQN
jgi:hypothetical protein